MMKKTKFSSAVSLILAIMLMFSSVGFLCFANDVQPKYVNIQTSKASLSISGINSTSKANMISSSSMNLEITMELQKLKSGSYETIKTWTSNVTGTSISLEKTRLINALSTYRLKVTFTAGSETIVKYAYP